MPLKKQKTSVPTQKAEKKRLEILKAAARCFRKTGFHQTSMQEICTETALGPGAVYRYFSSKDAIIEAMADDERTEARAFPAALGETDDFGEVLQAITTVLVERYKSNSDAGMMMEVYAEGLRNKRVGALVRKAEHEWVEGLGALLYKAQRSGQIDDSLDARHTALMLTAMWDGMVIRHAYHPDDKTPAFAQFFDGMLKKLLACDGKVMKKTIVNPTKRSKPVAKPVPVTISLPAPAAVPTSGSLFDEEAVVEAVVAAVVEVTVEAVVEADARQMSLI